MECIISIQILMHLNCRSHPVPEPEPDLKQNKPMFLSQDYWCVYVDWAYGEGVKARVSTQSAGVTCAGHGGRSRSSRLVSQRWSHRSSWRRWWRSEHDPAGGCNTRHNRPEPGARNSSRCPCSSEPGNMRVHIHFSIIITTSVVILVIIINCILCFWH